MHIEARDSEILSLSKSTVKVEDICLHPSAKNSIVCLTVEGALLRVSQEDLTDSSEVSKLPLSSVNYTHITYCEAVDKFIVLSHQDVEDINRIHLVDAEGKELFSCVVNHNKGYSKCLSLLNKNTVAVANQAKEVNVFQIHPDKLLLKENLRVDCKDICGLTRLSDSEVILFGEDCLQVIAITI